MPKCCPKDYPFFGSLFDPVTCVSSPIWVVPTKVGKLGISSRFAGFSILTRLDLMKNRTREGKAQQGKIHTEECGSHVRTNLGENTNLVTLSSSTSSSSFLLSLCTVFILTFDFVPSFDKNWCSVPLVWGQ